MHARPDKLRSHAFSHYVREYQITHAILKNAHHRGISLDDPRRLLDYLLRRKTGKPANLARLQDIVDGKSPKKTPPPPSRPINVVGKGLAKQVERLEQEVDESHAAYRRETRPFDKAQL